MDGGSRLSAGAHESGVENETLQKDKCSKIYHYDFHLADMDAPQILLSDNHHAAIESAEKSGHFLELGEEEIMSSPQMCPPSPQSAKSLGGNLKQVHLAEKCNQRVLDSTSSSSSSSSPSSSSHMKGRKSSMLTETIYYSRILAVAKVIFCVRKKIYSYTIYEGVEDRTVDYLN